MEKEEEIETRYRDKGEAKDEVKEEEENLGLGKDDEAVN